ERRPVDGVRDHPHAGRVRAAVPEVVGTRLLAHCNNAVGIVDGAAFDSFQSPRREEDALDEGFWIAGDLAPSAHAVDLTDGFRIVLVEVGDYLTSQFVANGGSGGHEG